MNRPIAIDLFSGCGGLTQGLKQAGFRVAGAVECDPHAVETYRANHHRVTVWQSDIRKLPAKAVMRTLRLKRGQLDLLAGCPPCQGFSNLRTRNGSKRNRDKRNNLVHEMLRFARVLRPKSIMMENVPRLARQKPFKELCHGLARLGYALSWAIKDAAHYRVPQRRQRLILLAGLGHEIPFAKAADIPPTVRDAIGRLAKAGKSGDWLHDLPEHRSPKVMRLIKDIPKDGGSRSDLPKRRQLSCHKRCDGFSDIYGRMAWNRVSPTITGGCFNPSKGRFLHPTENRAITLREAALLQSFPPKYKFSTSAGKEETALLIGNALPPELIRRHATEIARALRSATKRKASDGRPSGIGRKTAARKSHRRSKARR